MNKKCCGFMLAGVLALQAFCGVAAEEMDFSHVASGAGMAKVKQVGKYGMLPIYGRDVADGTYEIKVQSSSSKFRIEKAVLSVESGVMEAEITLSGKGYLCVYPGTGEEAAAAERDSYIDFTEEDGWYSYRIPVEALNAELPCAAFSKRKEKWYDRTLLFEAASLPEEALKVELPDYDLIEAALEAYDSEKTESGEEEAEPETETGLSSEVPVPVETDLADGSYAIEVTLTGGSGKATVSSPTLMKVEDGKMYAELTWSSSNYDYMLLGSERYENENTEGGYSHFTVPVTALDQEIPIIADTTAMGGQTEIAYTLEFFENTIGSKDQIPQEAAKKVVAVAFVIIVGGAVLNSVVKKRRRAS